MRSPSAAGILFGLVWLAIAEVAVGLPSPTARLERLRALHRRSQPDSVRTLAQDWLSQEPFRRPGPERCDLLTTWGIVEASFGRGRRAEPLLREALDLSRAEDRWDRSAELLRWVGVSVGLQGRIAEADSVYAELLDAALDLDRADLEGWAHVGRGWCSLQRGELRASIRENRHARERFHQAMLPLGYSWAMNTEAIALRRLGHFDAARTLYHQAIEHSRDMPGATMMHAMALANLGNLDMILGDPSEALRSFRQAEAIHLGHRHEREAAVVRLDRCTSLFALSRESEALAGLDSLRVHSREHGWKDLEANALNEIARIQRHSNRELQAMATYDSLRTRPDLPYRAREDAAAGRRALLLDQGRADLVVAELDSLGLSAEPSIRAQRARTRSRALRARGQNSAALHAIAAWIEADSLAQIGDSQRLDLLVEVARAARAAGQRSLQKRALEEAATRWESYRSQPRDPRWREERAEWASEIYPMLAELSLDPSSGPRDLEALFARMQSAKARTLLERIEGPRATALSPVEAPRRDRVLRRGESFLDLYLAVDFGILFTATLDSLEARKVPGREFWASRLRRLESLRRQGAAVAPAARALRRELLGREAEDSLEEREVLWCGDGPFLSSAGLISPRWTLVPSWPLLARIREKSEKIRGGVCAQIVGEADAAALPQAETEVAWLQNRFPSADCGLHQLWPPTSSIAALHFAGHVAVDTDVPWNSGLYLRAPESEGEKWPAWKISQLEGAPALVVLSGCATVRGRDLPGEGLSGLAAAFLSAGSRCVVATRWPVEDRFAFRFMRSFYQGLIRSRSVGESLDDARRAHRSDRDQPDAFVIVGDPSLRLELE